MFEHCDPLTHSTDGTRHLIQAATECVGSPGEEDKQDDGDEEKPTYGLLGNVGTSILLMFLSASFSVQ